jgi:hypothetical protein
MPERDWTSIISTNTESRPWTAEDWRAAFQRAKDAPLISQQQPYVEIVHPLEFQRRVVAGEIDQDGRRLR